MKKFEFSKTRRNFIKKMTAMMGFASVLPPGVFDRIKSETKIEDKKGIIHRSLGRTNIQVPILGIGVPGNSNLIAAALDAGIAYLDTAHRYGGGNDEVLLGAVLKGRHRDSFVIATKILGLRDNRTGLPPVKTTPAEFRSEFRGALETSLKRLRLDYVDILYLHGIGKPELVKLEMVKDVMLELKKEGKTRFIGASLHQDETKLIQAVVEEKIYDVILTSYNFRQPHRDEVKQAIEEAAKVGLGIVGMKVMAGAYWDRERKKPINAKAALKWVLRDQNVHCVIPGISTFEQLETDLPVMTDLTLTLQEREDLKFGEANNYAGLYCAQCGRCRSMCRYDLDIPSVMRSYMYAYGYRNPQMARSLLEDMNLKSVPCKECKSCKVVCAQGFNVPEKIRDIIRILDVPRELLV